MKFDFLSLRKSVQNLGGSLRQLRDEIEALKRKRDELQAAPLAREDVLFELHARIDSAGSGYANMFRQSLETPIRKGMRISNIHQIPILTAAPPSMEANARTIEQAFCFFFTEQMKTAAASALHAFEWPTGAITNAERIKQLEQFDKEIGRLENEERELASQAQQAGVLLS